MKIIRALLLIVLSAGWLLPLYGAVDAFVAYMSRELVPAIRGEPMVDSFGMLGVCQLCAMISVSWLAIAIVYWVIYVVRREKKFKPDSEVGVKTGEITNKAELNSVATSLHGARFDLDGIAYDEKARSFTLKCWVLETGPSGGASRAWWGHRLSLRNVDACKVNAKEKVDYYELATIQFGERERKLEVIAQHGIGIVLEVEKIDGSLIETGETRDQWE